MLVVHVSEKLNYNENVTNIYESRTNQPVHVLSNRSLPLLPWGAASGGGGSNLFLFLLGGGGGGAASVRHALEQVGGANVWKCLTIVRRGLNK